MTMLETVLRQTAGDMIANGITEPTEELFRQYFLQRLERNRSICERFITDPQFHDTITDSICREVYAEIRKTHQSRNLGQAPEVISTRLA